MIQPLVRRTEEGEARRSKQYSTIKTTPESIVKIYRLQKARREPLEAPYIFTPKRPRIPWHAKVDWNFGINMACVGVLMVVAVYFLIRMVIPVLRMWVWE
jgi:hypothetical protein